MRTVSFGLVLAALLLASTVAAQSSVGQRYGLHPVCGSIYRSQIRSAHEVVSTQNTTELEVSCFSYNLIATNGNCTPTGARVVMEFTDASGVGESIDFGRLYNGSLYATAFRFESQRMLRMYVVYPDFERCPASIYMSMYAEVTIRRRQATEHPFVLSANPVVMYKNEPYTMSFRSPVPKSTAAEREAMKVVMLHGTQSCSREAAAAHTSSTPRVVFSNDTDFTWTQTKPTNGAYVVCIQDQASDAWAVIAFVEAYGGNPAFFDSTQQRLSWQGTVVEFDFFGHALNATADEVRFVAAEPGSDNCGTDPSASGQVIHGVFSQRTANTTRVEATFRWSSRNLQFLVCYRHGAGGTWSSVPNFDTISRHVIQNVSDPDQQRINGAINPESLTPEPATPAPSSSAATTTAASSAITTTAGTTTAAPSTTAAASGNMTTASTSTTTAVSTSSVAPGAPPPMTTVTSPAATTTAPATTTSFVTATSTTATPLTTAASPPAVPAPTEPEPLASCGTAAVAPVNDRVTDSQVVRLTLNTGTVPGDFAQQVSDFLCLQGASNVSISAVTRSSSAIDAVDVYVRIECSPNYCNSHERQVALQQWAPNALADVTAADSVAFDGVVVNHAADDAPSSGDESSGSNSGHRTALFAVIGALVAAVVVLAVVVGLIIRHRRSAAARRHGDAMPYPDGDVVQGHVIEVTGSPFPDERSAPHTGTPRAANPFGNTDERDVAPVFAHHRPDADDIMAPIPPAPEKLPHRED